MIKLKHWAKSMNISYQTAWGMFKAGKLPGAYQLPTRIIVLPDNIDELIKTQWGEKQNAEKIIK